MSSGTLTERDRIRDAAAHWFNGRRSGDLSAEGELRFAEWIAADPAHAEAYGAIERSWAMLAAVADAPEIIAAREQDLRAFDRPALRRKLGAIAAALLLTVTTGWMAIDSGLLPGMGLQEPAEMAEYRTGLGQRSTFTLADGSVVTLDTDSELRVGSMHSRRSLELVRGRALFRVAKDPERPFVVEASGREVRALGTTFAVRINPDDITVTLVEGKVRVEEPRGLLRRSQGTQLEPGRQLVAGDDKNWAIARVDVSRETSWLNGQLIFMRDPLNEAVAEINRYSERKIVFAGGQAPNRRIIGVFKAGDVDSFVRAVELNGFADVVSRTDTTIELAAH